MNRKNTLMTLAIACLMFTVSFVVLVDPVHNDDISIPIITASSSIQDAPLSSDVDISLNSLALSSNQAIENDIITIDVDILGDQSQNSSWNKSGVVLDVDGAYEDLYVINPSVLKMDDGSYAMWYAGFGTNSSVYNYRIFRATSSDGMTWQKQGLALDYGNAYEQNGVYFPNVMVDDNNIYHMWYTGIGYNGGYRAYIHKAISYDDGITWQKLGVDVGYGTAADPDGATAPFVHYDGSQWHMWYTGISWGSPNEARLCHAHKAQLSDAWIKDGVVLNNDGPYDYPVASNSRIIPINGGYEMYYTGYMPSIATARILHATSPDGIAWVKTGIAIEGTMPLEGDEVGSGHVLMDGDILKCWYAGSDGNNHRIFYAEKPAAKVGQDANCTVSLYLDSISAANLIYRQTNVFVPADSNTIISFDWTAIPGDYDIIAEITNSAPPDMDNTNDMAIVQISAAAISIPSAGVDISLNSLALSSNQAIENDIITIDVDILGDQSQNSSWVRSGVVIDIGGTGEDLHITSPCVLKLDDGSYVMWYNGDGDDNLVYRHRIFRATSPDGIVWQKQGMVLDYGNAYEEYGVLTPNVIIDDNGIYHMWYTGIGSNGGYRGYIHKAISYDNGITWQKLGMELNYGTAADPDGVRSPYVHYDGTEWHMWYDGIDWGSPNEGRICHAHKAQLSDAWIKDGVVLNNDGPYDYPSAVSPSIIPTNTGYEMYYTGSIPYTGPSRILHATSSDGLTWVKTGIVLEGSLPLEANMIGLGQMSIEGDTMKCWYSGYDGSHQRLFYAEKPAGNVGQDANCTVSLYLDTISASNLIYRQTNVFVPADSNTIISFDWTAVPGDYDIIADITNSAPSDMDNSNDMAVVQISVDAITTPLVGVDISLDSLALSNNQAIENDIITIDVDILGDQSQSSSWNKSGVILDLGGAGEDLHVGKPCVLKLDDGSYVMWYNGDGDDSLTYRYRIFRATSQDGISWQRQGMALDFGNAYEEYGVLHPYVMVDDSGIYHMWYTGIGSNGGYRGYIHKAISYDSGITWQKLGMDMDYGTPADPDGVTVPFVLYDGTEWHMWYGGTDWGSPNEGRICHAHKAQLSDPWIKDGVVLNNDGQYDYPAASFPWIIPTATGYDMYYTGYAAYPGPCRILHASSPDGISWTRTGIVLEGSLPLETSAIGFGQVSIEGDTMKTWYTGYDGSHNRLFYAEKPAAKVGQDANSTVSFYLDTVSEATLIDRQYGIFVPADGATTVSTSWLADQLGDHSVIVVASDVVPGDIDLTNNQASGQMTINPFILPNLPPVADAGLDQMVCLNTDVQFDASGSYDPDGTIISYSWDFGDGSIINGLMPSYRYTTAGNFTVILTVIDNDGHVASDECQITVFEPEEPPIEPIGGVLTIDKVKTSGPDVVYTHTKYGWVLRITVANEGDSDVLVVVVHDVLPAELELVNYSASNGSFIHGQNGVGRAGSTHLTWNIGTMVAGEVQTLDLIISTKPNPAGKQEFTSPGIYSLNDGAWVTGNDAIDGEGLLVGPTPMITVIAIEGGELEDDTNLLPSLAITTPPGVDLLILKENGDEGLYDLETEQMENSKSQKNYAPSFVGLFLIGLVVIVLLTGTVVTSEIKKKKGTGDTDGMSELDRKLISGEITEEEYIREMKKKM